MKKYINNYSTTITTASVAAGATSFDVTTAPAALASGEYYVATLTDSLVTPTKTEIVYITGIATNTLTVVRGQEGTTGLAFVSGDLIDIRVTAAALTDAAIRYVAVSGSKTLALTDAEHEQIVSAAATITIPTNATVAFDVGTKISVLSTTASTVSITADTGVTLNGVSTGSCSLSAQYSAAVITKVSTDGWVVNGDTGAVA